MSPPTVDEVHAQIKRQTSCCVVGCGGKIVAEGWIRDEEARVMPAMTLSHSHARLCQAHFEELKSKLVVDKAPKGQPCANCNKTLRPRYVTTEMTVTIEKHVEERSEFPAWRDDIKAAPGGGFIGTINKKVVVGRRFEGIYGDAGFPGFCGVTCAGYFGRAVLRVLFVYDDVAKKWKRKAGT